MSEQPTGVPEPLLTIPEVAAILKVHRRTLYNLQGLPRIRVGSAVRYRASDVEEWLRANQEKA